MFASLPGDAAPNRSLSTSLLLTSSLAGLLAMGVDAYAQAPAPEAAETVVVTGTSIRGAAPVGSNLITVDRASIEATGVQTTQELMTYIPAVAINFGSSGQVAENSGGNASGPTIHSLGSQSANATLVLIDGHRIPPSGQTQTAFTDPSIIPAVALERVEVLPDGASSIYGADAVAGVLNFITRKDFTGWETDVQSGYASGYNEFNLGQLWGEHWAGGSVLVAYDYSSKSNLMNSSRSFTTARQDIYRGADATTAMFPALPASPPAGSMTTTPAAGNGTTGPFGVAIPYASTGSNFQNFNCPIATIAANNSAPAFLYPYNGGGISTTQSTPNQGVCDSVNLTSQLPSQTRNSILINARQEITDNLTASLEIILSSNIGTSVVSRGTVTATVYGPTGNNPALPGTAGRNPFYQTNATVGTASQTVRYDFDQLLGTGAINHNGASNMVGDLGLAWDIGGDWGANFDLDVGQSAVPQSTIGAVCAVCADLALNGTTNASGSANTTATTSAMSDPNGLGTIVGVTRPLTTLNALDVWDPPGATNKTSAATLKSLTDSTNYLNGTIGLVDLTAKVDGSILNLWAGPLKGAFGAEYNKQAFDTISTRGSTVGGASSLSNVTIRNGVVRSNISAYAEFQLPLVAPESGIPLVDDLAIDVSGRFDHFSDFGDTYNPKVGIDWTVTDGLKAHASYGTSFMAPEVTALGYINTVQASNGGAGGGGVPNGLIVPFNTTLNYSTDPTQVEFQGGGIAGSFVSTAAGCAQAGSNPVDANGNTVAATSPAAVACKVNTSTSPGIQIQGEDPNLAPMRGLSYSAGMDIDAGKLIPALDGLTMSTTYYNTKLEGYFAAQVNTSIPELNAFAPPAGWPVNGPVIQAVLAGRPITTALPPVIYTVVLNPVRNAFTVWQQGLDFSIHYRLDTDNLGAFNFGLDGNQIISFRQGQTSATAVSVVDGDNNGRQTGIEFTGVASAGWHLAPFTVQLQVQLAHAFSIANHNFPYNLAGPGRPAGTEHIGGLTNVNLHLAYDLPTEWITGAGMRVFADVHNVMNTPPPYADTANGAAGVGSSGAGGGNPIDRELVVGFTKLF